MDFARIRHLSILSGILSGKVQEIPVATHVAVIFQHFPHSRRQGIHPSPKTSHDSHAEQKTCQIYISQCHLMNQISVYKQISYGGQRFLKERGIDGTVSLPAAPVSHFLRHLPECRPKPVPHPIQPDILAVGRNQNLPFQVLISLADLDVLFRMPDGPLIRVNIHRHTHPRGARQKQKQPEMNSAYDHGIYGQPCQSDDRIRKCVQKGLYSGIIAVINISPCPFHLPLAFGAFKLLKIRRQGRLKQFRSQAYAEHKSSLPAHRTQIIPGCAHGLQRHNITCHGQEDELRLPPASQQVNHRAGQSHGRKGAQDGQDDMASHDCQIPGSHDFSESGESGSVVVPQGVAPVIRRFFCFLFPGWLFFCICISFLLFSSHLFLLFPFFSFPFPMIFSFPWLLFAVVLFPLLLFSSVSFTFAFFSFVLFPFVFFSSVLFSSVSLLSFSLLLSPLLPFLYFHFHCHNISLPVFLASYALCNDLLSEAVPLSLSPQSSRQAWSLFSCPVLLSLRSRLTTLSKTTII